MSERSKLIFTLFKKLLKIPEDNTNKEIDTDCVRQSLDWYDKLCGLDIDRDHKYLNYFSTFCTMKSSSWKVYHTLNQICSKL